MRPALPITSSSTQSDCPHLAMNASDAQLHCPAASSAVAACSCAMLLSFSPLPLLAAMDDSPPDSPTMPWRPGSSAYPPAAPMSSKAPKPDSSPSCIQQSKRDLQKLYDTLSEASYDLSLRDIVEPPYSIDGSLGTEPLSRTKAEPSPKQQLLPIDSNDEAQKMVSPCLHQKQQLQSRSISSRKFESSIYSAPASPNCKLAFSFSYPRRGVVHRCSSSSAHASLYNLQISSSPVHKASVKNLSLPSLEHVLATPHDQMPALPLQRVSNAATASSSILITRRKHHCKRSLSDAHHALASKLDNVHTERRGELNFRGTFSVTGSSNRVHPSSQCSSCSSYTIFFKSRCTVCGKLYCSNCAKDELDSVSDGRRCKSTCNSRLSSGRFTTGLRSKCWPLCCNVDVLNNTRSAGRATDLS